MNGVLLAALFAAHLMLLVSGCDAGPAPGRDAGVAEGGAPDCGGCPTGLTCCETRFRVDRPRCVDLKLNPEHCGRCGNSCGTCSGGQCTALRPCSIDGGVVEGCPADQCSLHGAAGFCCPPGTSYEENPLSFAGCCPDTDVCGCAGDAVPGGFLNCPLSVRRAKSDIRYLGASEIEKARAQVLSLRLAEYAYRRDPAGSRHLGFIIDDLDEATAGVAVAPDGEHVDLYGYTSLAVATLQAQQRQIDQLKRELQALRSQLGAAPARGAVAR